MIAWHNLIGIIVGLCGIAWLLVRSAKKRRPRATLPDGLLIFLTGVGIAAGIRVCILAAFSSQLASLGGSDRIYMFMAGIATIWLATESSLRLLGMPPPQRTDGQS